MTDEMADRAVARALGDEIRRVRDQRGWTRGELVERMDAEISAQALANYEYGVRPCSVPRFVEICQALDVSAPNLLGLALQRARIALYTHDIVVDLRAVRDSAESVLHPLRTWARNRLTLESDGSGVASLDRKLIEQWAIMLGVTTKVLVRHLLAFTPNTASG